MVRSLEAILVLADYARTQSRILKINTVGKKKKALSANTNAYRRKQNFLCLHEFNKYGAVPFKYCLQK